MKRLMFAAVSAGVVFASVAAERKLYVEEFRDRMAGAWLGQSVGVAYGCPTEFRKKGEFVTDDLVPAWKPERVNNTFQQDDLYVEMSFLETLERRGVDVGAREAGLDFANSRYRLWCANANARDNLRRGIAAPDSSHPKNHPTTDDIDYQIEADFSGILSPGLPTRVLRFGQTFGRIMNYGDGLYAGDFIGGMYAAAYFEKDRVKTVEAGLACIPAESGYAEMVRDMLAWYRADPKDWKAAWKKAVDKYGVDKGPKMGKVSFFAIDVKINGAMVLLGYLWGEGDVFRTMDISTRGGYDSDCNPSSALGVLGVQLGLKGFGPEYVSKLDRKATWEFTSYTWEKLLASCEKLTREIVVKEGGKIEKDEKGEYFLIPEKPAAPGPALSSAKPGPGGDARLTEAENAQILYAPCPSQGAQSQLKHLVALQASPWIGDGLPDRNGADWYEEDPAPEFCAEFTLPEGVNETKVHFACAGFGWFCIDGAYMNADGLDTLWSVYDKTVYATSTVVRPKKNKVFVRLGNGFYNLPPLRFWGSKCFREALAHGRPCFKMTIDGVKGPLVWKWRKTNVIRNSVYLGTEIDATRPEDTDWKPASVVKGPKGKIVEWPQSNPQMGVYDIHHGTVKKVEKKGGGGEVERVQVVDFGVNASGVPEFFFENETRGTKIEIVYGERLNPDGTVNVLTQTAGQIKNGNGGPGAPALACQRDVYVCGGQKLERFSPPFTWHVFRYAEIRGAKHLVKHPTLHVRSMVPTSVLLAPAAKNFKTDNADLAKLHELCQRTFQANLIGGVQSDCPGRERLGYGGDIVATCEAMCLNFSGMKEIYLKILRDFADEAADDGWITETAPYVGIADAIGLGATAGDRRGPISWALVVPVLMDTLLRHYPDAADRVLAFYPVCTRYVGLMEKACPDGIVPNCIGDHEALERAPNEVTATAHWHEFVRLTATFARRLGKTDDAVRFEALAAKIRAAFQARFVKEGIVANGTQSAQAIGLHLGLVPEAQVKAAEARLVKAIEEKGYGPTTGIFSTRYMLMYLAEHGRNDLARRIVLHKGYPGWLHMLERGATTLWETWKESDNVFSNCHPMFGSVDEWILRFGQK